VGPRRGFETAGAGVGYGAEGNKLGRKKEHRPLGGWALGKGFPSLSAGDDAVCAAVAPSRVAATSCFLAFGPRTPLLYSMEGATRPSPSAGVFHNHPGPAAGARFPEHSANILFLSIFHIKSISFSICGVRERHRVENSLARLRVQAIQFLRGKGGVVSCELRVGVRVSLVGDAVRLGLQPAALWL